PSNPKYFVPLRCETTHARGRVARPRVGTVRKPPESPSSPLLGARRLELLGAPGVATPGQLASDLAHQIGLDRPRLVPEVGTDVRGDRRDLIVTQVTLSGHDAVERAPTDLDRPLHAEQHD